MWYDPILVSPPHLLPRASCHLAACLLPLASCLAPLTSCLPPLTSHLIHEPSLLCLRHAQAGRAELCALPDWPYNG
ncbi:MAG: hypothetical protein EI684_07490 [Candidatus Viridilinea halotolerans]|uniref:Uncharacterized protein n=1 Tax=Candidatus Viridilinea halotolerans TaxID=2491704 RepID=A0A426U382_9CHLR|nr:MAG: hypothetical protein EI684_07490 [Candidatus Viridilinea halotolerans]